MSVPATVVLRKKILLTMKIFSHPTLSKVHRMKTILCLFAMWLMEVHSFALSFVIRSVPPCGHSLLPHAFTLSFHYPKPPHCKRSSYFASLAKPTAHIFRHSFHPLRQVNPINKPRFTNAPKMFPECTPMYFLQAMKAHVCSVLWHLQPYPHLRKKSFLPPWYSIVVTFSLLSYLSFALGFDRIG